MEQGCSNRGCLCFWLLYWTDIHNSSKTKPKSAMYLVATKFYTFVIYLQGGQHLLKLVDFYGGGVMIFLLAVLEVVAISWIYGTNNRKFYKYILYII
jgi:hypothetical protein